jgi:trehalose-phosphatase
VTPGPSLRAALERFAARRPVLVAFDFDGVIAPIVDVPSDARALPRTAAALAELARRDGVLLALVSGRALADLRAVADPPPDAALVASHGAEVAGAPGPDVPREALEAVVARLEQVVRDHPGTALERKPASAVLHTRQAERDVARRAVAAAEEAVAGIEPARVLHGKEVVEVSVVDADKGSALLALADALDVRGVFYAGDDTTDEHAFAALAQRGREDDVTVKVGDGDTAARYRVQAPEDVAELVETLLSLTGGGSSHSG